MTQTGKQELIRLKAVLNAYGADENRWPEQDKRHLLKILENSDEAKAVRLQARQLDDMLDAMSDEIAVPSHLMGAVLQDAERIIGKQGFFTRLFGGPVLKPASGLIAAIFLGISVGWFSPNLVVASDGVNLDDTTLSETVLVWESENG
jgi:hypothetical protein